MNADDFISRYKGQCFEPTEIVAATWDPIDGGIAFVDVAGRTYHVLMSEGLLRSLVHREWPA